MGWRTDDVEFSLFLGFTLLNVKDETHNGTEEGTADKMLYVLRDSRQVNGPQLNMTRRFL